MISENPCAAPNAARDLDDSASDLIVRMHNHSRAIIETELQRLSRRVPTLDPADLRVIDAALEHLSESLILRRLRTAPRDREPMLQRLLDIAAQEP